MRSLSGVLDVSVSARPTRVAAIQEQLITVLQCKDVTDIKQTIKPRNYLPFEMVVRKLIFCTITLISVAQSALAIGQDFQRASFRMKV